jgi:hypothetical protein
MWTPQWVSLEMELPTVLVIPTFRAPFFLQYLQDMGTDRETSQENDKTEKQKPLLMNCLKPYKYAIIFNLLASQMALKCHF